MKRLEHDEIAKLLFATKGESKRITEFLARTGARVSEALEVRARDVDVRGGTVSLPTLKRRRRARKVVPVGSEFARRIVEGRTGRLFRLTRQSVWRSMQEAALRAGVDPRRAHPHALRHAFSIAQVEAGVPIAVLRKWLGHASLNSTQVYVDEVEAAKWTPAVAIGGQP